MNGKGDSPRPLSVDSETFTNNWERIFGKKQDEICEYSNLPSVSSYDLTKNTQETKLHDASKRSEIDPIQHPGLDEDGERIEWAPC